MSKKLAALASTIDQSTLAYVTEAITVAKAEQTVINEKLQTRLTHLQAELAALKLRITDLEAQDHSASEDDKYALTKAKLVRLMKENGWYD